MDIKELTNIVFDIYKRTVEDNKEDFNLLISVIMEYNAAMASFLVDKGIVSFEEFRDSMMEVNEKIQKRVDEAIKEREKKK